MMMMQPTAPPMMGGPASQPLMQQPPSMFQPPPCAPPAYAPVAPMAPVTMMPVPVAAPAPSGPVQNNNTAQNIVVNAGGGGGGGGMGFDPSQMQRLFVDPLGLRSWSTSICDCLNDLGSCTCALLCTPMMFCRLANRMNECACISCAVPGGFTAMRVKVRTMGGIRGSICQDCLVTYFCCLCAACQMSRELDAMGL